jgi:hypothetical protein
VVADRSVPVRVAWPGSCWNTKKIAGARRISGSASATRLEAWSKWESLLD